MKEYKGPLADLVDGLATELITLAEQGKPLRVVGFAGPPGCGKSTAAAMLAEKLAAAPYGRGQLLAGLLPLDGFHKSNHALASENLTDRKGAPDTFDNVGYLMALDRVHAGTVTVYAPEYSRELHEPISAYHRIEPQGTVITEGNYLALQDGPWLMVREQINLLIYVSVPREELFLRLRKRQMAGGASEADANNWIENVDSANIITVEGSRSRADRIWIPDL